MTDQQPTLSSGPIKQIFKSQTDDCFNCFTEKEQYETKIQCNQVDGSQLNVSHNFKEVSTGVNQGSGDGKSVSKIQQGYAIDYQQSYKDLKLKTGYESNQKNNVFTNTFNWGYPSCNVYSKLKYNLGESQWQTNNGLNLAKGPFKFSSELSQNEQNAILLKNRYLFEKWGFGLGQYNEISPDNLFNKVRPQHSTYNTMLKYQRQNKRFGVWLSHLSPENAKKYELGKFKGQVCFKPHERIGLYFEGNFDSLFKLTSKKVGIQIARGLSVITLMYDSSFFNLKFLWESHPYKNVKTLSSFYIDLYAPVQVPVGYQQVFSLNEEVRSLPNIESAQNQKSTKIRVNKQVLSTKELVEQKFEEIKEEVKQSVPTVIRKYQSQMTIGQKFKMKTQQMKMKFEKLFKRKADN